MASKTQIFKNIAYLIKDKPQKIEQLKKVQSISIHCTSDDGIRITAELYYGGIVRYLIEGTRSRMTITANAATRELTRKPRGEQAWHTVELYNVNASDILALI